MASPPRRSRKHRAAAPTKFTAPGSDDDYHPEPSKKTSAPRVSSASKAKASPANLTRSSSSDDVPLMARKKAKAAKRAVARRTAQRDEDPGYESSGSNSSIPAVVPEKSTKSADQVSPAGKRGAPKEHPSSPAKKQRIVFKKKDRSSDGTSSSSPTSPTEPAAPSNLATRSTETTPATSLAPSQPSINRETEAALYPAGAANLQQVNEFLTRLRDNADAAQKSVQGVLDAQAMQAKITALEAQLAAVGAQGAQGAAGDLAECQKALEASRAKEKELSASFESLRVKYNERGVFTKGLIRDVSHLTDKLKERSDAPCEKVTDDQVGREWLRLVHEIQNFTLQVLNRDPTRVVAPPGANSAQVNLLRAKRRQDPELANFHFQKYIWDCINNEVFQAGSNVWGGRGGQSFNRLCIDVAGKIVHY